MNTAWIDSSSTDLPADDSSTDDNDKTQARATTPPPNGPSMEDLDESPVVRLVRTHERLHAISKPASLAAEDRPTALPITVLTNDAAFADQIRVALDSGAAVTAISTVDEAAALAASGRCPIVVTDTTVTRNALESLAQRLRAHDPATTIVVSGNRDQGGMFIGLQSSGAIGAFLLKPITTAATRLVIEAATRRYLGGATIEAKRKPPIVAEHAIVPTVSMPAETRSKQRPRPSWSLVAGVAGVVASVVAALGMSQRSGGIDPNDIIARHLALAESAFAAKRLVDTRDGAAHHYQTVLEMDPQNFAAHRGLDAIARELSRQTQTYMLQQRLADAAISLERLRELQPSYAELPLLDSQLRMLQDSLVASHAAARAILAPLPEKKAAPKERPAPRSESRRSSTTNVASIPEPIKTPAPPQKSVPAPADTPTIAETPHDEPQVPISRAADSLLASIAPPAIRPEIAQDATPAIATEAPQAPREPAKLIKYVPPQYPSEAHVRRMEGWIEISMEIAPNGDVVAPRIEAGEKRQLFGRPALAAVRQWKYAPDATRETGKRSSVRLEFKME